MAKTIEAVTVEIGVEPSEAFYTIANALGFVKERTCKMREIDSDYVECAMICSECEQRTSDFAGNPKPNYCPNCGARVVSK